MILRRTDILIVDDETIIRDHLFDFLTSQGFKPRSAANINEAQKHLSQQLPDLLISDIRMPDGDGYDLIGAMDSTIPAPPSIIITGCSPIAKLDYLAAMGVGSLIRKPLPLRRLLKTINCLSKPVPEQGTGKRDFSYHLHLHDHILSDLCVHIKEVVSVNPNIGASLQSILRQITAQLIQWCQDQPNTRSVLITAHWDEDEISIVLKPNKGSITTHFKELNANTHLPDTLHGIPSLLFQKSEIFERNNNETHLLIPLSHNLAI